MIILQKLECKVYIFGKKNNEQQLDKFEYNKT